MILLVTVSEHNHYQRLRQFAMNYLYLSKSADWMLTIQIIMDFGKYILILLKLIFMQIMYSFNEIVFYKGHL